MLNRESGKPNKKPILRLRGEANTIVEVELPSELEFNPYDLIILNNGVFISIDSLEDVLIYRKVEIR
jgi:hypothetical protein